MIRAIPNINTARLTLAAMRPGDFDRYAEIWAMPEVVHHISGEPVSRDKAWGSFLRIAGHWQMTGFGQWAIIEQASRRMIGQIGFFIGTRALGEDFDGFPEAGWIIAPEVQGMGYGSEAALAAHDWFDRVIPGLLGAMVAPDHVVSMRLADRLGYRALRHAEFGGTPVLLLRRDGPGGSGKRVAGTGSGKTR